MQLLFEDDLNKKDNHFENILKLCTLYNTITLTTSRIHLVCCMKE